MQKKGRMLLVFFSLFLLTGCAKRMAQDDSADEVDVAVQEETSDKKPRFIYSGTQGSDETGVISYYLLPKKNQVEVEYVGDTEEDWWTYTTELVSFTDLANGVKFVYIDEDGQEVTKSFEILSESIVIDEEKNRYEW